MSNDFFSIPELTNFLRSQIRDDRRALHSLALVNRRFHELFSPELWETLWWSEENSTLWCDEDKRHGFIRSRHMVYVRELVVTHAAPRAASHQHARPRSWTELERFGLALIEIVRSCPHLRRFRTCPILVHHDLLQALSSRAALEEVDMPLIDEMDSWLGTRRLSDPENVEPPDVLEAKNRDYGHPERFLAQVRGLRRLGLDNLWGDMVQWRENLLELLLSSHQLEHLRLSFNIDIENGVDGEAVEMSRSLFGWLCKAYGEHRRQRRRRRRSRDSGDAGGRQDHSSDQEEIPLLQLRSLHLGQGFRVPDLATMTEMVDLTAMESIYIFNDLSMYGGIEDGFWVEWDLLSHEAMPNLRYLSLGAIDEEVWNWLPAISLASAASGDSEDNIPAHGPGGGDIEREMSPYPPPSCPSPRPRLLSFHADANRLYDWDEDEEPPSPYSLCAHLPSVPMVTYPVFYPDEEQWSSGLPHLKNCTWLTHLAIDYVGGRDFAQKMWTEDFPLLYEVLTTLTKLEAFYIPGLDYYRPDPDRTEDAARKMAEACPSLGYIKLGCRAWLVRRNSSSRSRSRSRSNPPSAVEMGKSDQGESGDQAIFSEERLATMRTKTTTETVNVKRLNDWEDDQVMPDCFRIYL